MGDWSSLQADAWEVAPRLLGCVLHRDIGSATAAVRIVEVEAYDQSDAASHSYRGETPRTGVMFGPAGHLYVYFTYGMHYCMNIVTGPEERGSAVLIRAAEPVVGVDVLRRNRPSRSDLHLTNGPAKLCQALRVDKTMNGHNLRQPPLRLELMPPIDTSCIVQTTRVGISQAKDQPWRFFISNNDYVSKI